MIGFNHPSNFSILEAIIEALAIRFQVERQLWREPLYQLSLQQLTELRQAALLVDSLQAFETTFQAVQAD